jgi:hypothetical protein
MLRATFSFFQVLALCTSVSYAQQTPSSTMGEQLFVEGTALFQAPEGKRDPERRLEKLLASAELRYVHAPFGLCLALSVEPQIINLIESYGWCEVAARAPTRHAVSASERATQVLGRIALEQGNSAVAAAKARAAEMLAK